MQPLNKSTLSIPPLLLLNIFAVFKVVANIEQGNPSSVVSAWNYISTTTLFAHQGGGGC